MWIMKVTTEDVRGASYGDYNGHEAPHPGGFIKRSVLPDGLPVTDAAEVLYLRLPELFNLLNEKASLSPEMALRVEKAFGMKMDTLLRMQARYGAYFIR